MAHAINATSSLDTRELIMSENKPKSAPPFGQSVIPLHVLKSQETGESEQADKPIQTYETPDEHLKPLRRHWSRPRDVRAFATQANAVATMVLNGEIDLETARIYASTGRLVVQSMSIEARRARAGNEAPNTELKGNRGRYDKTRYDSNKTEIKIKRATK